MINEKMIDKILNSPNLKDFPLVLILKVIQEIARVEEELCEH